MGVLTPDGGGGANRKKFPLAGDPPSRQTRSCLQRPGGGGGVLIDIFKPSKSCFSLSCGTHDQGGGGAVREFGPFWTVFSKIYGGARIRLSTPVGGA